MNSQEAIMGFSQGEKIKSGVIWTSQVLQLMDGLAGQEKTAWARTAGALVGMISHEVMVAQNVSGDPAWEETQKDLDKARVMIDSGVPAEAITHLTRALSRSTQVASRAMTFLKDQGLL